MPATKKESESQLEKFKQAARELETDDSEDAFDAKLKAVGRLRRDPRIIGKPADKP
jgi:hypothetical protein